MAPVQCEQKDARVPLVGAVDRIHMLADLIAQQLHWQTCLVAIGSLRWCLEARFVGCDQVLVMCEDR